MSGKKGRSGPKKKISTIVNEAIDSIRKDLPELFQALRDRAMKGDRDAAIYLIDRAIGKPKQQTEITGGEDVGMGMLQALLTQIYAKQEPLQLNYKPLQLKEGEEEVVNTT